MLFISAAAETVVPNTGLGPQHFMMVGSVLLMEDPDFPKAKGTALFFT